MNKEKLKELNNLLDDIGTAEWRVKHIEEQIRKLSEYEFGTGGSGIHFHVSITNDYDRNFFLAAYKAIHEPRLAELEKLKKKFEEA